MKPGNGYGGKLRRGFRGVMTSVSVAALLSAQVAGAAPKPPKLTREQQIEADVATRPQPLQPFFRSLLTEGERNLVLNADRIGVGALQLGQDDLAAEVLDQGLERIEAIYADNPKAAKARSTFVKEAVKDFKGEPYERAMAFYYRGVLYLRAGDYENARASFQQGQLQDAFAEDQRYKSDYAVFEVLSGWSSQCLGDQGRAEDFYGAARQLRADIAIPKPDDRTLYIGELGRGPEKYADGQYQENLRFRGVQSPEAGVVFLTEEHQKMLLGRVRTAQGQVAAAEQAKAEAAKRAETAVADLERLKGAAETAAQTLMPVAMAPPVATVPALPAKATPAQKAAQKGAQAALAVQDAEKLSLERAALEAAIAVDKADGEIEAAQAALKSADAAIVSNRAQAQAAQAALAPFGLKADPAAAEAPLGPPPPVLVASMGENVFRQAITRGDRMIDGVLAGKAAFKEGAENFASGAGTASLIAVQTASSLAQQANSLRAQGYNVSNAGVNTAAYAGLAFAAVGLLSSAAASAAKPQADIRYWDSLPGEIHYATGPATSGQVRAVFRAQTGAVLGAANVPVRADPSGRCSIAWVRSTSALDIPASAPNSQDPKKK